MIVNVQLSQVVCANSYVDILWVRLFGREHRDNATVRGGLLLIVAWRTRWLELNCEKGSMMSGQTTR